MVLIESERLSAARDRSASLVEQAHQQTPLTLLLLTVGIRRLRRSPRLRFWAEGTSPPGATSTPQTDDEEAPYRVCVELCFRRTEAPAATTSRRLLDSAQASLRPRLRWYDCSSSAAVVCSAPGCVSALT